MTAHEHEGPAAVVAATSADAADALEQRIPAVRDGAGDPPPVLGTADAAWEADEADALQQRLEVGYDDEREHDEAEPEPPHDVSEGMPDPLG